MKEENKHTYYPVVIPTLCRFEHFKNCIGSLLRCNDADKTEVIIGLDYPPSEKYFDGYNKIKSYLSSIKGFKKLKVFEHKENLGAGNNMTFIRNEAFKTYDACIFSEDDNIFAPTFLEFMNWGLNNFRDDESIFSISGYSWPVDWNEKENVALKENRYFSAWGCGIWKNKREKAKKLICADFFRTYLKQKGFAKKIEKSPQNFISYTDVIFKDDISCYDITYSLYMYVSDKFQIVPPISLVRNTGWDNSGINCKNSNYADTFNNQSISTSTTFCGNSSLKEMSVENYENLEKFIQSILVGKKRIMKARIKLIGAKIFGVSFMRKIIHFYRYILKKQNKQNTNKYIGGGYKCLVSSCEDNIYFFPPQKKEAA